MVSWLGLLSLLCGLALFYPAAQFQSYGFFLSALFVLGLGFTLLQIAANPYVAILGDADTASSRLNFTQAFNSLGTTIAPVVGAFLIYELSRARQRRGMQFKVPYIFFSVNCFKVGSNNDKFCKTSGLCEY